MTVWQSSPNAVLEDSNDEGLVTSYKCDHHVKSGKITAQSGRTISSYYEMLLPCQDDPEDSMRIVASELLDSLGDTFGLLPDGRTCTVPDTTLDIWVIGLSSSPSDSLVPFMECKNLSSGDNEELCCVVVQAPMTFWVTNTNSEDEAIMKHLAACLNEGAFTYKTVYIGSMMEFTGNGVQGQLPGPPVLPLDDDIVVTGIVQAPTTNGNDRQPITIIGGFLMAALIIVVVFGFGLIVSRRRKRRLEEIRVLEAAERRALEFMKDDDSVGPVVELRVDDETYQQHAIASNNSFGPSDIRQVRDYRQGYAFDIANSMKNHIMAQYGDNRGHPGPHGTAAYPPFGMDETSDSEVDSWAQTEGTVGSLEENLEQITAEI